MLLSCTLVPEYPCLVKGSPKPLVSRKVDAAPGQATHVQCSNWTGIEAVITLTLYVVLDVLLTDNNAACMYCTAAALATTCE